MGCIGVIAGCSGSQADRQTSRLDTLAPRYWTAFPDSENPISQGGRWLNGGVDGSDWTNVSTTPHRAIGHQMGARYTDGTAILTGTWSPDQSAWATVFVNGQISDICLSEVELRLRSSIEKHMNRGYEVSYKVSDTKQAYVMIVRWSGELGDFKVLTENYGERYGVQDGDVVSATIVGNRIDAFKNGQLVATATDDTYQSGNPGIGFNLENSHAGCPATNDRYGFSRFSAADAHGR